MGVKENPAMADSIARTAITITSSIKEKPLFFEDFKNLFFLIIIFIFSISLKIYI